MAGAKRAPLQLLHTSDVHLAALNDISCRALENLIELAQRTNVNLFLIVGDLFDHNRVDQELIDYAAEQLQRLPMPVVILPGNHDCLIPNSVYHRTALWEKATNVYLLTDPDGELLVLPEQGVTLWGRCHDSYESDLRPMEGIPWPTERGMWHIIMAHGCYTDSLGGPIPSYQISAEEIMNSGWDYVALGHLPTFGSVCEEPVKAFYCGSPLSGTAAVVSLDEEKGVRVSCYYL
jgi:DNA repair exonuclease SbcCD nuclease subunit